MRANTTYTEEIDGIECEASSLAVEHIDLCKAHIGDKLILGYCAHDEYSDTDTIGDAMGTLYSFHRNAPQSQHEAGLKALGNTPDGEADLCRLECRHYDEAFRRYKEVCPDSEDVDDNPEVFHQILIQMWHEPEYFPGDRDARLLSCYDHSGQTWSLSGSGTQCRWDTSNRAGVWVPSDCLRKQLDYDEAHGKNRWERTGVYCKQFLEQYNDLLAGNVYGVIVETFDEKGISVNVDSCWGFVGYRYAEAEMRSLFEATCKTTQAEYDEAVKTQNGRQIGLL